MRILILHLLQVLFLREVLAAKATNGSVGSPTDTCNVRLSATDKTSPPPPSDIERSKRFTSWPLSRNPSVWHHRWGKDDFATLLNLSGGATAAKVVGSDKAVLQKRHRQHQLIGYGVGAIAASYLLYSNRAAIVKILPSHQELQDSTLNLLERINTRPLAGLLCYIIGLSLWEAVGLSTIPVETAAGMAFGFYRGIIASSAGKLLGAALAFQLGRSLLKEWAKSKMEGNDTFDLIEMNVAQNPFRTAVLLKFSCFPEFVKNYGSSLLSPITTWHLVLATVFHGCPFTCLWTYLGTDTKLRLENTGHPPDRLLQSLLLFAGVFGFVGSPLAMAWWIRDLRRQRPER